MVSQKNRKIAQHFGKFQHFWKIAKKAILYRKFLHENSTYRTNGVYHNVANGKCNKTVNSEFWFLKLCHRDFFTESLSFFKNARNWKIFEMANLKSKNLCDKTLKIKNLNWQFCCIFRWLRHGILCFFWRCYLYGENCETKLPILRFFKISQKRRLCGANYTP